MPAIIFFCDPERPAVSVPAPGNRHRWEFMLLPDDHEDALLDPATIHKLIMQKESSHGRPARSSFVSPSTHTLIRSAIYTFQTAIATRFSHQRIFLLGDAAHLMPPFGGQGMNSGLRDAHNLCWKLASVLQQHASPRLLDTYQQERAPHAAQMILFSSILGKLIMPTASPIARLRDLFFRGLVNPIPPLRAILTEMQAKPQPNYPHNLLLPAQNKANKALIGQYLPQPTILTSEGQRVLLDDVLGPGFSLLRLYEDPDEGFSHLQGEIWDRLGVRRVYIHREPSTKQLATSASSPSNAPHIHVIDYEHMLADFLGQYKDYAILIRPDRYILGAFRIEETAHFEHMLLQAFGFSLSS